ncbi:probable cellulose synthase A catalytic subunit 8 [UDP-forming] isoform X1 [Typha angustifolia]|uniref:probable cellulose synthase A catalytic subunit 8 [UDP-forming] isoform X1 n=2 Tax=Typha angustifolia TaxID=59011 RepID=UPI003C2AC68F
MDNPIGKEVHNQVCQVCQYWLRSHQGVCPILDNELQCTSGILTSNSSYILDSDNLGSSSALYEQVHDDDNLQCPKTVFTIDVPERRTIQKGQRHVHTELPSRFIKACTFKHPTFGIWNWEKAGLRLQPQPSASMSSRTNFWRERLQKWKLAQEKISSAEINQEKLLEEDDSGLLSDVEFDQMKMYEELRQPLSRKVPVPSSRINPYRAAIILRLVALVFFLQYRLANPVRNAYGLWLTSVICEVWFSLSWILEQLPKWKPIRRETYPERLCLRYNQPGEPCELAFIDVFVSTTDPTKEPPLVTSNTVLSMLAVDYPAERVTCYVSDDGASMITLETLQETCQFARTWVPFCRKFNIEPRAPEYYFSQKVDYLKNSTFPTFAKERRTMKRQYEEFKVRINCLIAKFQNVPCDGWVMTDGKPWPGNDIQNHPGIIQILLGCSGPSDAEDRNLPQLVYVSREKRPGYQDNKVAGAMNSLVRVSAILTNGAYILNLNYNHYINNSKAFLEAMCFMMDTNIMEKACFVQFPQRFDGANARNQYSNHNTIFYDVNLKGLDGIQGPLYVGTGCFFNRKALYGYDPPMESKCSILSWYKPGKEKFYDGCGYASTVHLEASTSCDVEPNILEAEYPSLFLSLKQYFGQSLTLIASIIVKDDRFSRSETPEDLLKEAINVVSCDYEENTSWGREIGWMYGSRTSDILTSLKMHARGWRSIYCTPARPAFKGSAPVNLSDRLNQLLQWALGSIEILLSRHCPIWYSFGSKLRWLERMAYINATIYPLTSIPLVIYCTLPAICLISGKFIIPPISYVGNISLALLFLSVFTTGLLEMRWSGVGTEEWWRSQQFWVIGGVSSHLFAIIYAPIKILVGKSANLTVLTEKFVEEDLRELYVFRWTSLLVVPTTIILINMWAIVAGISTAIKDTNGSWVLLFAKLLFSFMVLIHLYPFLKGLLVRQQRVPTIIVIWSLLLASLFSMLWIRINPFVTKFTGPNVEECGIYC